MSIIFGWQNKQPMVTDQEIVELVEPHTAAIRRFYDEALEIVNKMMNVMEVKAYKRLKATALNNIVLEKAKPYFRNVEGVRLIDKYESLILCFDTGIKGRFKKLSKTTFLSSNIETARNNALIQPSLFPEYPPSVLVEIGYWNNDEWSEFERILVVKRVDNVAIPLFEIPAPVKEPLVTIEAVEIDLDQLEKDEQQLKLKKQ